MSGFVVFDHVYRRLQSLFVNSGWKRLSVVESDQDTDVKEMIFGNPEVTENRLFGCECERGFRSSEIHGNDEFVNTGI